MSRYECALECLDEKFKPFLSALDLFLNSDFSTQEEAAAIFRYMQQINLAGNRK